MPFVDQLFGGETFVPQVTRLQIGIRSVGSNSTLFFSAGVSQTHRWEWYIYLTIYLPTSIIKSQLHKCM